MKSLFLRALTTVSIGLLASLGPFLTLAQAQADFPTRPIRIISPFAAGSISDTSLRLLTDRLAARLKGQVIIDNQPRAGGITAATAVLTAPADGHTLALLSNSTAISVSLFKQLPYDPIRDFAPISSISNFANVLATGPDGRYVTLADFITAARAKPGMLNVGTSIVGSTNHLAAALLKSAAKIDFVIVPYRGPAELLTAVIRGDVDMIVQSYGALRSNIEDKKIRALAITTAQRASYAPHIEAAAEAGVPDFEVVSWNGLFAPVKTPAAVIDILHGHLTASLSDPELQRRFAELGVETSPSPPEELGMRMKIEIARWARVINDAGIEKQ